jgi:orotate phosphoribosyltransferase
MNFKTLINCLTQYDVIEPGTKTLKSGQTTDHFYNFSKLNSASGLRDIGRLLNLGYGQLEQDYTSIFTSAYKGIVLATAMMLTNVDNPNVTLGYLRKEDKDHGELGRVVGHTPVKGDEILLVDDVITTGGSLIEMANYVRSTGATIVGALAVIDRTDSMRTLKFIERKIGAPIYSLITDQCIQQFLKEDYHEKIFNIFSITNFSWID